LTVRLKLLSDLKSTLAGRLFQTRNAHQKDGSDSHSTFLV